MSSIHVRLCASLRRRNVADHKLFDVWHTFGRRNNNQRINKSAQNVHIYVTAQVQ